ncbi:recombinase family protein [Saccharopolyspora elongata]|uniref:recombinase family protein n=1 Tax=Saccharopolyspora elongata TaxID=2530387 RepID=UPI001A9DF5BD|nr:recombinase family protein [Saccharopolyspora elongata]
MSQLDALARAQCTRVFSEKISTRIKTRPEFEKALALAHEIKQAAQRQQVVLTVHEMKRLARNAAELMTLSATLQAGGIGLEMLTGPLTGSYDPRGAGSILFAVLAVGTELDRNYIRKKTLEGQQAAAAKGNHGGRPKVIDDDSLTFALALKAKGVPVGEIAKKLTIKTGKKADQSPRSPRCTGHSPKPRKPQPTTTCRSAPNASASGAPMIRRRPKKPTYASASKTKYSSPWKPNSQPRARSSLINRIRPDIRRPPLCCGSQIIFEVTRSQLADQQFQGLALVFVPMFLNPHDLGRWFEVAADVLRLLVPGLCHQQQ